ncbi:MAG: MFS transporter [Clostridiaceae bacterium]|jgi:DHA3 family macrolide efflux protein-like MFS transporter|nr:MFS transporter [Eubacteriales bacterium]NLV47078.1 MFS transporter [Clostridiaceae bacterium]
MEHSSPNKKQDWKKNVTLFLASQTVSLFGSSLVQYAIMWHITMKTQSGIMMTISIICGFVPMFILSPIAGVWADRYNRKILIACADALIAFATLILAILYLLGYGVIWMLFAASAIRAVGTGIQTPAVSAILPQIIPEEQLIRINGINNSIQSIIMIISPMVSGALLTTMSIETIFFIDVLTAMIAIYILLVQLSIPAHARSLTRQTASYFSDLQQGLVYIRNHRFVKKYISFFAVFFVFITPISLLTPLQVTRSFGNDVWRLTAIEIAFALGMMLGGAIIASWGGFRNRIFTMSLASIFIGLCAMALGIVPVFWGYLVIMGLAGITVPLFNTPATVLIQEKIEESYLGRVFGVIGMISTSVMPLSMLIYGPVSDVVRIEWLLLVSGFVMFIMGFMLRANKVLVEAGLARQVQNS